MAQDHTKRSHVASSEAIALFELGDHIANDDSTTIPIHRLPPRKKQLQDMEDHHDDCGDDQTPLTLPPSDDESSAITHAFQHDDSRTKRHSEIFDDIHKPLNSTFTTNYLHGSDHVPDHIDSTPTTVITDVLQLLAYLKTNGKLACVDVVELCGGHGGVLKVCSRFHLR